MTITRVRLAHHPGRQTHRRRHPCPRKRSHHGLRHLYRKYVRRSSVEPPLCKGRWVAVRRLGGIVKHQHKTIPQSASLTAPFTQGGLLPPGFCCNFVIVCYDKRKKEAVVMIYQILIVSNCLLRKDYVHDNCKQ